MKESGDVGRHRTKKENTMRWIETIFSTSTWIWWVGPGLVALAIVALTASARNRKVDVPKTPRERLERLYDTGSITRREYEARLLEMWS
jgi:hypothetical protein